jgi:hypothetical protein
LGGAALGLAGAGVKRLANDSDQTTMNFGETAGTLMQGAGTGLGLAGALGATGFGLPLALLGAAGYGIHGLVQRNKARVAEQAQEEQDRRAQMQLSRAQSQAFIENSTMTGADLGFNTGNSLSNSYVPSQQIMYKSGGQMIKRADGSYSKKGLWDNIRANKGSGKKPTKQMLEQEQKIKGKYQGGSFTNQMVDPMAGLRSNPINIPQNFNTGSLSNMSDAQMKANEQREVQRQTQTNINRNINAAKTLASNPELAMDATQLGLQGLATSEIPVVSSVAGGVNALGYLGRGAYYGAKGAMYGDSGYAAKGAFYGGLGAMSGVGMIPGAGIAADASALASIGSKVKTGLNAAHHTRAAHLAHDAATLSKQVNLGTAGQVSPSSAVASGISQAQNYVTQDLEAGGKIQNNYQYGSFVNEMGLGGDPQARALRKQNRQTRRAQKEFERKSKKGVQNIYEAGGFKVPGGKIMPLQGNAVEFIGKKHSQGGIMLDSQTEVEGGETMDKIEMKNGGKSDYIFSEHLKLGKKSFAKRHKELLKRNASQAEIQQLAKLQEKVAAKQGRTENGERNPDKIMQTGGFSSELFDSLVDIKTAGEESPMKAFLQMQETYSPSGPATEDSNIYAPGRNYNFDWQARNNNKIDYEFDITGPDATKILNTPWAEAWGLPKDASAEDLQNWYKNTYTPRIREYYKSNPEIVEKDIQEMLRDTSDPNHENFKRKLSGPDGKPLTGDALIDRAIDLATDNKVGSWHSIVPSDHKGSVYVPPEKEAPPEKETPPEKEKPKEEETPEKEKEPRDLSWMGALPGLLQLQGTPTYPKARTVSPQMQRNINLPRINMNAERAANSAMNVGTRRQFANQASGPAGMAASLAANQQARQQNLEIGNLEGRTNKDLMAQEASINANIASQNASSANQAGQFNAQMLQQRDQNQFDQNIYTKMHNRDVASGVIRDAMAYKAEERYANSLDDVGAYMRFVQEEQNRNKTRKNTTTEEKTTDVIEETKKFGGKYIKRVNAVKRKKKK